MNELWIYDVIGEGFFEAGVTDKGTRDAFKEFQEGPIDVHINSPGGSVNHAVAIRTMLDQWKWPVNVHIDGLAASAASYIATVGDTISIADGSLYMLHNPWSMVAGDAAVMRKEAEVLDKLGVSLQTAYAQVSGLELEKIANLMDEETWLTAQEAVELGFAHKIPESLKAAAFVIPEKFGFKHPPQQATPPTPRAVNAVEARRRQMELLTGRASSVTI